MAGGALDRTMEAMKGVPGITEEQLVSGRNLVESLDYSNMRAFRVFCQLPGTSAASILQVIPELQEEPLTFFHLEIFELFASMEGVDADIAYTGLKAVRRLEFTSVWAAKSLFSPASLSPQLALDGISLIRNLGPFASWAAKSFFEINGLTGRSAVLGLEKIKDLSEEQCRTVESCAGITGIRVDEVLAAMDFISRLSQVSCWNARGMFKLPEMTGKQALDWLDYFVQPEDSHDALFLAFSAEQKKTLLAAFYQASDDIVWHINNFHAVTGAGGEEIPSAELRSSSFARLNDIFAGLPASVRNDFGAKLSSLAGRGDKAGAVAILRRATAAARQLAAKECSTANIYVLLSRITILYDSSYRLVLVPELQKRLDTAFKGKLFDFLQVVDPGHTYVATFISSMAQKGRLARFFPDDEAGQGKILELVADSAFRDEKSLIFFAASFANILHEVKPAARHFLLEEMIDLAGRDNLIFVNQIRVILQYYLEEQPDILGDDIVRQVRDVLGRYGEVDLLRYARTPFGQWRDDGILSALSVYNSDDDSRLSFLSNSRYLLSKGYTPRAGEYFLVDVVSPLVQDELKNVLADVIDRKADSMHALYLFLKEKPVVVDFVKRVHSLTLSHSVVVFHDRSLQKRLVEEFITGGHEMFIHRGHSYWLEDHLLIPLREIVETGSIDRGKMAGKQRFLSLGSCGGVNAYLELTGIFCNNIDILGTMGTGMTEINNAYNVFLFETIASGSPEMNWREMDRRSASMFKRAAGRDYLLPGGLASILYKIIGEGRCWFR